MSGHAPEHAGAPAADTPPRIEFDGVVCSGLGEGARFTQIGWVDEAFRRELGFIAWPGTLNLRVGADEWADLHDWLRTHAGIRIAPAPGFCAAKCFMAVLNGRWRAALVLPEVGAYPDGKLEFVAPLALRSALGLSDHDCVRVRLLAWEGG